MKRLSCASLRVRLRFHFPEPGKFIGKSMPEASIVKKILAERKGVEETVDLDGVTRLFGFTLLGKGVESVHGGVGIPGKTAFTRVDRVIKQTSLF